MNLFVLEEKEKNETKEQLVYSFCMYSTNMHSYRIENLLAF